METIRKIIEDILNLSLDCLLDLVNDSKLELCCSFTLNDSIINSTYNFFKVQHADIMPNKSSNILDLIMIDIDKKSYLSPDIPIDIVEDKESCLFPDIVIDHNKGPCLQPEITKDPKSWLPENIDIDLDISLYLDKFQEFFFFTFEIISKWKTHMFITIISNLDTITIISLFLIVSPLVLALILAISPRPVLPPVNPGYHMGPPPILIPPNPWPYNPGPVQVQMPPLGGGRRHGAPFPVGPYNEGLEPPVTLDPPITDRLHWRPVTT
jgi:hypothetical protein